jgi:hypothetical protein
MSYRRPMSALRVWPLVLGLMGGCLTQVSQPPNSGDDYYPPNGGGGDDGGWGSGEGGTGGSSGYGCHADTDCGGTYVCARDGECLTKDSVRVIHVVWTLDQQAASATSCATAPTPLELSFADQFGGSTFGFAPVPCVEGKFTIDKMPTIYTDVALGPEYGAGTGGATGKFDATGTATLDLPY